ncbi:ATP-binding protein [Isachenkonia alkalipeptolytica]|uniref:ATP-binding protein n=1 Tax=Isachenkonia alkalipeptolytica TaxID=2565777 RepID=A0AA43XJR3_9CLOT|nr:DUF87 domain-containing protein [Isachenkonia alkalipeptolytica]NBG88133.1 ATP-binding protein [Isachenkonia alkalipeptolytica]
MNIAGKIVNSNPLAQIIQEDNFVGWVYSMNYDEVLIITNDAWKMKVKGIPQNCFLTAATFNPQALGEIPELEREVMLFRVLGSAELPQNDDMLKLKVDFYQNQKEKYQTQPENDFDDITKSMVQFSGLRCRVLGTFYIKNSELNLGSDLESFTASSKLNVHKPTEEALKTIVNHVDPIRKKKSIEDAKELGFEKPIDPIRLGTVRYTSTDRLHRSTEEDKVPFFVQPSDFLARRTGVLGMTRTGKSNLIKHTVSAVKNVSDKSDEPIGQLIYDINGEYANANMQDKGSISEIYKKDTIRYRMVDTPGFEMLQNNFYYNIQEGFNLIREKLEEDKVSNAADINVFKEASFDEPEEKNSSEYKRWQIKTAAYLCLLSKAGFEEPDNFKVKFTANQKVQKAVFDKANNEFSDPKYGFDLATCSDWMLALREANKEEALLSSSGKHWVDDELASIINLLARKNTSGNFISGYKLITPYKKYHSARRKDEIGKEIYNHLKNGKIVILDLSVGEATLREKISKQIASDIFNKSMNIFIEGKNPPNIVIYVEEAHNLIGKGMDLTETWPRVAKEGAKYRISLVYATQEVSSIHPNILANTENWIISHLNNIREINELAKFYDFEDFSKSLLRAQDVGFARVKTLSSPFVVPVQIDLFNPSPATTEE